MKEKPWRRKTRDLVIDVCLKVRPNLPWRLTARADRDLADLTLADGPVSVSEALNLRAIFKCGKRNDFTELARVLNLVQRRFYEAKAAATPPVDGAGA